MMVTNDLIELNVRDGDQEIKLRRPNPTGGEAVAVSATNPNATAMPLPALPTGDTTTDDSDDDGSDFLEIKSPMVGTFYAAPDPDSPPFVHVGSKVGPSSVVCVLEAMKVFSEIKAEVSGTVERVLAKNEQAVEFGQVLFLVRPE